MKTFKILKRGKPLRKYSVGRSSDATLWEVFSEKYAVASRGADGLIACGDGCGQRERRPDLHHVISKTQRPDLYFDKNNLLWLTRGCHDKVHNRRTTILKSQQPASSKTGEPIPLHQIRQGSQVRRGRVMAAQGKAREPRTIYNSRRAEDGHLLSRPAPGSRSVFDSRRNAESGSL